MKSKAYVKKALAWAKKKGFSQIKAHMESDTYDTPSVLIHKENGTDLVPDITGLKTGGKSYIEISTKTEDVQQSVTKWKLLSTLANMKGGKLYLLAPRGHKAFTDRLVNRYNIHANIISL